MSAARAKPKRGKSTPSPALKRLRALLLVHGIRDGLEGWAPRRLGVTSSAIYKAITVTGGMSEAMFKRLVAELGVAGMTFVLRGGALKGLEP